MKGAFPPQRLALYAKARLFLLTQLFKTVRNSSVKSGALCFQCFQLFLLSIFGSWGGHIETNKY